MPRTLDELEETNVDHDPVVGAKFSLYAPRTLHIGVQEAHGVVFTTRVGVNYNDCVGCTAARSTPEPIKRSCCPAMPICSSKVFVEDTPEAQAHYIATLLEYDIAPNPR